MPPPKSSRERIAIPVGDVCRSVELPCPVASLTLGGTMVETPVAGGMTAIITDWEEVNAGNVDAH